MNCRERTLCALDHREPDQIPLDLGAGKACKLHVGIYRRLLDHLGIKEEVRLSSLTRQLAFASDALLERLESDVRVPFAPFLKNPASKTRQWEDEKYFYHEDDWGTVSHMPKNAGLYYDLCRWPLDASDETAEASYAWPSPAAANPASAEQAARYRQAGYPVAFVEHFGNGFLQHGPNLFGFDDWLAMLGLEEDRVRGILDKILELKMRYFTNALTLFGDRVDVVSECDDLGAQNATFVSPEMFRSLFKPYWKKLFDHIRSLTDAKIYLHCCGAIEPLLGDLIDVGVQIINPVQISAAGMDPVQLKRKYGKDLTFWGGGIDTQKMLPYGTPAQIRDHVKRNIEALARDGGFVFSTVHNVQADVPVENFMAMWETFRENRKY